MRCFQWTGRMFVAVAFAGIGVMQCANGAFVRLVPALPVWVPAVGALARATGALMAVSAGLLCFRRSSRAGACCLAGLLVLVFLTRQLPTAFADPMAGYLWTNPLKVLALLGGVLILAEQGNEQFTGWANRRVALIARVLLASFLVVCGIQHFVYAGFVDSLVPAWIPPGARFWTLFAGVALLAGGLGLLVRRTASAAAVAAAAMIFLWVLLLHLPRAVSETAHAFELAGAFEALGISGVALLMSRVSRGEIESSGPSV